MSHPASQLRRDRGWSQEELARRAGLSRPEVSAIETGRVVPSVRVALALSRALGVSVEALFGAREGEPEWAWAPGPGPCRLWLADVGPKRLAYPCETSFVGFPAHDAVAREGEIPAALRVPPTLVVAGCDPAVRLLEDALRERGVRVLALTRSSRNALALLEAGRVHVAGVHLAENRAGNAGTVRKHLGRGYQLVRWALWEAGVAVSGGVSGPVDARHLQSLRWVAREEGSGARRCMDALFLGHRPPKYELVAGDHREVAQTIRLGAADAGICVRVAADEAGLTFRALQTEAYDLCFRTELEGTPEIQALLAALHGRPLRRLLGEVPGYDTKTLGRTARVA